MVRNKIPRVFLFCKNVLKLNSKVLSGFLFYKIVWTLERNSEHFIVREMVRNEITKSRIFFSSPKWSAESESLAFFAPRKQTEFRQNFCPFRVSRNNFFSRKMATLILDQFKGIEQPFELRGERRLIKSIMINWRSAIFFLLVQKISKKTTLRRLINSTMSLAGQIYFKLIFFTLLDNFIELHQSVK